MGYGGSLHVDFGLLRWLFTQRERNFFGITRFLTGLAKFLIPMRTVEFINSESTVSLIYHIHITS